MQFVPDLLREQTAASLKAYLDAGIPPQGITWTLRASEGLTGRFPVKVAAGNQPPATLDVVLGDDYPPGRADHCRARAGSPIKELKITCTKTAKSRVFWNPLASIEHLSWRALVLHGLQPARMAVSGFTWLAGGVCGGFLSADAVPAAGLH